MQKVVGGREKKMKGGGWGREPVTSCVIQIMNA